MRKFDWVIIVAVALLMTPAMGDAKPLAFPFAGTITSTDGLDTVDWSGDLMLGARSRVKTGTENGTIYLDQCGYEYPYHTFFFSYTWTARSKLTFTDASTGEALRSAGSFKHGYSSRRMNVAQICNGVYFFEWMDFIEVTTGDRVRQFRVTFLYEVNLFTGDLLSTQVLGVVFN